MANKAYRHKDDRRRCKPPQSRESESAVGEHRPRKKVAAYLRDASASATTSISKAVAGAIVKYGKGTRRQRAALGLIGIPT